MVDSPNATEQRILNNISADTGDDELNVTPEGIVQRPTYKMVGESRIPMSKHAGPLWKSRKEASIAKLQNLGYIENWDECIRYYQNDQTKNRSGTKQRTRTGRLGENGNREQENIVFSNTSALVPAIYAKNPECEVTATVRDNNSDNPDEADDKVRKLATTCKRLANALAAKKDSPGFNLKPKARKAVVMTTLTNISYLEAGYTKKDDSSEQALIDLQNTTLKWQNAKNEEELREAEGELMALEQSIDFLRPSGPWVKFRHPKEVLRDPDSVEADLSDAKWVMVSDYIPTALINAVYREKVSTDPAEWKDVYKPTHVVTSRAEGVQEEINNFSLLKDQTDMRAFGYTDEQSYQKGLRTKVWMVWDKITRRVYMFNDMDWCWPIWVWEDPYGLEGFFPLAPMTFYTDPEEDIGKSEVLYYLDQQDAINDMNNEFARARKWVQNNIFYNKTLIKDQALVEKFLKGGEDRMALGVTLPQDVDINKVIGSIAPPSANYLQLFDTQRPKAAVAGLSSVTPVMQGQQFKTNTTNDAIETYNSNTQTRLDEKIDAVEECIGNIMWMVIQMCLQFMPADQVASILGPDTAQTWQNMAPEVIRNTFSVRVVGGSTQKPTGAMKKAQALQIGQVLGQYANAGQGVVIMILLKIMERAFDEVVVSEEDWQFIRETIMQSVANSNPTGANAGGQGDPAASGDGGDPLEMLATIADAIPPEIQKALGLAMARGVPLSEAVPRLVEQIAQTNRAA